MNHGLLTMAEIQARVRPLAEKYGVEAVYVFGSYARGEADETSDVDFLVLGGKRFRRTRIFALAEEMRAVLHKDVDVFEISEINEDSDFYRSVMKERLPVA